MRIVPVLCALAAVGSMSVATAAVASDYDWSFVGAAGSGVTVSGVFATDSSTDIISGSGILNGFNLINDPLQLSGAPSNSGWEISASGYFYYDNQLPVDYAGLLFTDENNSEVNIYVTGPAQGVGSTGDGGPGSVNYATTYVNNGNNVNGVLTISAAPEPATWALMIVAAVGFGGALRLSRRQEELAD